MTFKSYILSCIALSMSLPFNASAYDMGTGSTKGNYYEIGQDIKSYCEKNLGESLNVVASSGSTENLIGLQNKTFSMAIVQEDVLNYHAKRNPKQANKDRIKIISGLHEESVHLLIPKNYSPDGDNDSSLWSSFFGSNEKTAKPFSLDMLKGQKVGSWGGSLISTEALGYFYGLDVQAVEVKPDVTDLSKPLILVGGAPYSLVQEYLDTGNWSLASLDYDTISKRASFYNKQTVNYQFSGKMHSIDTVGVRALLVGKAYRKKSRNNSMTELATCIKGKISDLADDPDTNPNWASVYDYISSKKKSDWAYFPINKSKLKKYQRSR